MKFGRIGMAALLAAALTAAPAVAAIYGKSGSAGGTSSAPSPLAQAVLTRAQALLGSTVTTCLANDFPDDQGYSTYSAGAGAAAIGTTTNGGVVTVSTSATAGSSIGVKPHNFPSYVASLNSGLWYAITRAKITTTPDANSIDQMLNVLVPIGSTPSIQVGALGAASTTVFTARSYGAGGTLLATVTSTIPLDTSYHKVEAWLDATTNVSVAIDGTVIGTFSNANLGTGPATIAAAVFNQSTAANQSITVDYWALCMTPP